MNIPLPPPLPPPLPSTTAGEAVHISSTNHIGSAQPAAVLAQQTNVSTKCSDLVDAIQANDINLVLSLMKNGVSINQNCLLGTPLSVAVRQGNLSMVKLILDEPDCNINARDYDGETPICLALRKELKDISLHLISKGCLLNKYDPVTGLPPLSMAVQLMDEQIIDAILNQRCDIDQKDTHSMTPLCHAALLPEPDCIEKKRLLMMKLLENGAVVNTQLGPPFSGSVLHKAIIEKCPTAVAVLLGYDELASKSLPKNQRLVAVNKTTSIDKNTSLHLAVAVHDSSIVEMLLKHGVKANLPNAFSDTPLSKALKDTLYDQQDVVQMLLKYGVDVNFEDRTNNPRRKGPCRPLFAAIENGEKHYVDMLLEVGADLSVKDYRGYCAIMPCLANGLSIGLLRHIVQCMDDRQIKYDISSSVYLQKAFPWQSHLQFLIDKGLDVKAIDQRDYSVVQSNAVKLYPKSLRIALENGLDPDYTRIDGSTTLCKMAGLNEYWSAIQLLVQFGANINSRDVEDPAQLTPVQKAFAAEFEADVPDSISQFRYFINCGAKLPHDSRCVDWKNTVIQDRLDYIYSEDDDSESGSQVTDSSSGSNYRGGLLSELESLWSPLPLSMSCRSVIRQRIITLHSTAKVNSFIYSLVLPTKMKQFLCFENVPTDILLIN